MSRARLVLLISVVLAGCSSGRGHVSRGEKGSPAPVVEDVCPVKGLEAQGIADRVRVIRDDENLGMTSELRAGYLAMELANAGVPESSLLKSFKNGKFAALASWLGNHVRVVDINKFSNCEEN